MAATIRKELGVEVDEVPGAYGEFSVLVDGERISRGDPIAVAFAIVPQAREVVAAVRAALNRTGS